MVRPPRIVVTMFQRLRVLVPGFATLTFLALAFVWLVPDEFRDALWKLPLFFLCVLFGPIYLMILWATRNPSSWQGPFVDTFLMSILAVVGVFARPIFQTTWSRIVTALAFVL